MGEKKEFKKMCCNCRYKNFDMNQFPCNECTIVTPGTFSNFKEESEEKNPEQERFCLKCKYRDCDRSETPCNVCFENKHNLLPWFVLNGKCATCINANDINVCAKCSFYNKYDADCALCEPRNSGDCETCGNGKNFVIRKKEDKEMEQAEKKTKKSVVVTFKDELAGEKVFDAGEFYIEGDTFCIEKHFDCGGFNKIAMVPVNNVLSIEIVEEEVSK